MEHRSKDLGWAACLPNHLAAAEGWGSLTKNWLRQQPTGADFPAPGRDTVSLRVANDCSRSLNEHLSMICFLKCLPAVVCSYGSERTLRYKVRHSI
eukprot:3639570-Amphidinium_carterae.1